MRILHCADLHMDLAPDGPVGPGGESLRLDDYVRAWNDAVAICISEGCDAFIFAGDAFTVRRPAPVVLREFAEPVSRLRAAGTPVVCTVGNHDQPIGPLRRSHVYAPLVASGLDIMVGDAVALGRVDTRAGVLEVLHAPYPLPRLWLGPDDAGPDLHLLVAERYVAALQRAAAAPRHGQRILAGHLGVIDAMYGSERALAVGDEPAVSAAHLALQGVQYAALGHLHMQQRVAAPVEAWYAGSMQSVDFGEEGQEKGVLVVDVGGVTTAVRRFKVHDRRRATFRVELPEGVEDPTSYALARVDAGDGWIVRLVIGGAEADVARVQTAAVGRALAGCFSAEVRLEATHGARRRSLGPVEDVGPLDALEAYLVARDVPEPRRRRLAEMAGRMMEEAEGGERGLR